MRRTPQRAIPNEGFVQETTMTPEDNAYEIDPTSKPESKPELKPAADAAPVPRNPANVASDNDIRIDDDLETIRDLESDGPKDSRETEASASAKPASSTVAAAPAALRRPLVRSARYEWALVVAGSAAALYVAACLAGQQGLFPVATDANSAEGAVPVVVEWSTRFLVLLKGIVRIVVASGCLVAGAYFLHLLDRRPVGDLRAIASRMLAIAAISILVMLFPIEYSFVKKSFDVIVPIAVGWALLIPFFRVSIRDAGVILIGSLMSITVLALGSVIVNFAMR